MSNQDLFKEIILEESQHPSNQGTLENADVTNQYGNASCGDKIAVAIKFGRVNQQQVLENIKWTGDGCSISVAAMSLLSQQIQGKTVPEVMALGQADLEEMLGIDAISPARVKCLMTGLKAVRGALEKVIQTT